MKIETKRHDLNREVTLRDRSNSPFKTLASKLTLIKLEVGLIECRLTLQVPINLYQQIETESLFSFRHEIRNLPSVMEFLPEIGIQIEIALQPSFLTELMNRATDPEGITTYFLHLNQEQPTHPLFFTENWLLLSVTQNQERTLVGYRTLWDYLSPVTLAQGETSGAEEPSFDALTQFFKEWSQNKLSTATEKAQSEILNEITNFLEGVVNVSREEFTKLLQDIDLQITDSKGKPSLFNQSIEQQMLDFFIEDDWSFTKLSGEPTLQLAFQGKNGAWHCYAKAKEENQQFVFYSICPISTPEEKRGSLVEFLTRANYAMILGNFELDYNDGEVRYKTSIDVEGDRLTFALIKRLVYTNVMMMDIYLPGIISVVQDDASPAEAIRSIEQPDTNITLEAIES